MDIKVSYSGVNDLAHKVSMSESQVFNYYLKATNEAGAMSIKAKDCICPIVPTIDTSYINMYN